MKKNTTIITGLFMLMILAFTVDPSFINNFQNNILGKAIVILTLIYLTVNNVTLGLLFTLAIILISSRVDVPMIEGLKNKKKKAAGKKITSVSKKAAPAKKKPAVNKKITAAKKKPIKTTAPCPKCKTLEELLREERAKRMQAKTGVENVDEVNEEIDTEMNDVLNTEFDTEFDDSLDFDLDENGIDRITLEETFRVRNPSTIPVTKEAFRVRELNPYDGVCKHYGGMCSLL